MNPEGKFPSGHGISQAARQAIESSLKCHASCVETVNHSLGIGGLHMEADHITLLMACAEVCQATANLMLMGSGYQEELCGLCTEICRHCAGNCAGIVPGDERLLRCAVACQDCAAKCEQIAGVPVS